MPRSINTSAPRPTRWRTSFSCKFLRPAAVRTALSAAVRARRRRRGETKPPVSAAEQQRRSDKRKTRRRLAEANRRQVQRVLTAQAKAQALERATVERAKLPHLPTLTPRTPHPTQDATV